MDVPHLTSLCMTNEAAVSNTQTQQVLCIFSTYHTEINSSSDEQISEKVLNKEAQTMSCWKHHRRMRTRCQTRCQTSGSCWTVTPSTWTATLALVVKLLLSSDLGDMVSILCLLLLCSCNCLSICDSFTHYIFIS